MVGGRGWRVVGQEEEEKRGEGTARFELRGDVGAAGARGVTIQPNERKRDDDSKMLYKANGRENREVLLTHSSGTNIGIRWDRGGGF